MKTNTDHLPADKQAELQKIVTAIEQRFPAEMIILFGSYARGDWVDDRYKEDGTTYEYKSDYDILVVLDTEVVAIKRESNRRWQNKLRRDTGREAPLNVIFHGIDYLNSEIEDGSYFFMDVLKEGIMLHDSGKFQLATPKLLDHKQRTSKARLYFNKWFDNAEIFYLDFETNFERAKLNKKYLGQAAFMLHQATERYYACVLLVYTDYKPKVHDLDKLNGQVCKLDNRFKTIFPRKTEEEERLFTLLKKAYIDSRYKLDYSISRDDLVYLSERVQQLRELTELACKEKIDSFMSEK
ncbi:HEPN domain-containing protein [Prolixibacter sp. NT017]|uniref:HEPN domain-containing protein n=1 Tax=Prolixibacter sp. NT017 TaxID=2652390 RepID=UPI00128A0E31|nr:HEPN domain-containing protein [Prolixibacter sp. NT017]GET25062.1 DNA-binding protein [Prolixibacter sp. NT017]